MKWWHCVLSTKPPVPLWGGREWQSWMKKRVHSGAGSHCICKPLRAAVWDLLLQVKWLKSQFIPLWNNSGRMKADQSMCRKREAAVRKTGMERMFWWCLCNLSSYLASQESVFFLLYFSPILLSLYRVAEPCSRLGAELTAAWPEPMP